MEESCQMAYWLWSWANCLQQWPNGTRWSLRSTSNVGRVWQCQRVREQDMGCNGLSSGVGGETELRSNFFGCMMRDWIHACDRRVMQIRIPVLTRPYDLVVQESLSFESVSALVVKYLSPVEQLSPFKLGQIQKLISDIAESAG